MRLVITRAARTDLKDVGDSKWGPVQKKHYLAAMRQRFSTLREHPTLGRLRNELSSGYRSLLVGQHAIFCRIAKDEVVVVRVLHQRMDFRLYLSVHE